MYRSGWDVFAADCGSEEEKYCRVCNQKMKVERNAYGKTSMFGSPKYHDQFTCNDSDEKWHRQALALRLGIEKTPSKRISELLEKDLEEVLDLKQSTKEFYGLLL